MTKDRAAVVAAAVTAIVRRALHGPALEQEIADVLRDEFAEIQQQTLSETRAEDPHE